MTQVRAILQRISDAIVATNVGQPRELQLLPTGYRRPIEFEPVGGSHRRFECLITGVRDSKDVFGAGVAFMRFDVAIRVSYARMGGDAGGGDRQSVNVLAGTDSTLILDTLIAGTRDWDSTNTGIREVTAVGGVLEVDGKDRVVWTSRIAIEAALTWPT